MRERIVPLRVTRATAALLAFGLVASASQAQHASELPWVTGERLVKRLGNVDPRTVAWTPESPFRSRAIAAEYSDMVNAEFVHGYIQAVHDASEGKEWCWGQYKPKPDELVAEARRNLQRMTAAHLKRSAAELIVDVWRTKFPCSTHVQGRKK